MAYHSAFLTFLTWESCSKHLIGVVKMILNTGTILNPMKMATLVNCKRRKGCIDLYL